MRSLLAAAVVVALSAPAIGSAQNDTPFVEVVDRILVKVGDELITLSDLARFTPIMVSVEGLDPRMYATEDAFFADMLERHIENRLAVISAEEQGLAATDAEVEQFILERFAGLGTDPATFDAQLRAAGIDPADFRDYMSALVTRQRLVQLEVTNRLSVSDEDIEAALADQYPDGLVDTWITTSHILVSLPSGVDDAADAEALDEVQRLRAEIAAGTPFEDVAARVNPDASRNTGGRIGRFRTNQLHAEYSAAAVELEVGEISGPVRTSFGYHLIRLEALETTPVDDADRLREEVMFELRAREAEVQQGVFFERLREDIFVEVVSTDFGT